MLEQKSAKSDDYPTHGLVYACIQHFSRSHFAYLKMADQANVWDLPSKIFLALVMYVDVASKPKKGTLC